MPYRHGGSRRQRADGGTARSGTRARGGAGAGAGAEHYALADGAVVARRGSACTQAPRRPRWRLAVNAALGAGKGRRKRARNRRASPSDVADRTRGVAMQTAGMRTWGVEWGAQYRAASLAHRRGHSVIAVVTRARPMRRSLPLPRVHAMPCGQHLRTYVPRVGAARDTRVTITDTVPSVALCQRGSAQRTALWISIAAGPAIAVDGRARRTAGATACSSRRRRRRRC
ncbi:hypothetical protein GGR66_000855 [Xanthomonas sp. 3498]|nr:hypothetical protein [Xanthomonas sp. 3498]